MNSRGEEGRCGHSGYVRVRNILSRLNCYTFMMLITNIPIPDNMKPRHVARDLGLKNFCMNSQDGLRAELERHIDDHNLADYHILAATPDDEKKRNGIRKGFAANWLAFCPNLIETVDPQMRRKVFDHAMYRQRVKVSSWATNEVYGPRNPLFVLNRDTALEEYVPTLLQGPPIVDLFKKIESVHFNEEDGVGPGVVNNWYQTVCSQIVSENFGLFEDHDSLYSQLIGNMFEGVDVPPRNDLLRSRLKAAGRFFGHVIYHGRTICTDLSLMFVAKLTDRIMGFEGVEKYDTASYGWMGFVHSHTGPAADLEDYLVEGIDVWPDNQQARDLILDRIISNFIVQGGRGAAYQELLAGMYDIVPRAVFESGIKIKELHEILFGTSVVDVEDMIQHWYRENIPDVQFEWLKNIVRSWRDDPTKGQPYLRRFVEFVTGSSRVKAGGFDSYRIEGGEQKRFRVRRLARYPPNDFFPITHTCFNTIDIPNYSSEVVMKTKMERAVEFGSVGIGRT